MFLPNILIAKKILPKDGKFKVVSTAAASVVVVNIVMERPEEAQKEG